MTDARFEFFRKWLVVANVIAVCVGLLVAFASESIVFDVYNHYTREVYFAGVEASADTARMMRWLFGVIGGTIVGFHVIMIFLAVSPFRRRERWAHRAMVAGMLAWFVIDSALSLREGALHNVLLINIPALVMIGIPLVATWREFKTANERLETPV